MRLLALEVFAERAFYSDPLREGGIVVFPEIKAELVELDLEIEWDD